MREMSDKYLEIISRIRELIQNNDLKSASQVLFDITEKCSPRFRNEIIVHRANIKQIYTEERQGIISSESTKMEKKRAMFALLDLLDEISESLSLSEKDKFLPKLSDLSPESKGIIFEGSVNQIIIQQTNEGENIVENGQKNFTISGVGGNVNISAPITIADNIENSFNALAESKVEDNIKDLLEQLLNNINEINKNVPSEQAEVAEEMARDAETLIKEATSSKPRRKWYELSVQGIKDAAINLGEIAAPVLTIVERIVKLLVI